MRFSIEARVPFSDDLPLIQYVFRIPSSYKIYGGWNKYLLRKSMANVLPSEIINRKDKIGFATPSAQWLVELKDDLKFLITEDLKEFINVKKLVEDWDDLLKDRSKWGRASLDSLAYPDVWRIISFAVWRKVFQL